ncbi:hypothetical protein RclHR1_01330026 [Rhizophagus clarus]|uniref:Uncharacterized protein n=1 Tax=Rhizophagus clarus TaxID=94130 RepID=A0A2Z6QE74_9GLOM|nr:hypothetical protein RclHR1_01330026 [Rhizophagus clarus]
MEIRSAKNCCPKIAFAVAHPCGIYTSILLYQLFPYIDRYEVVRRLYRNSLIESFSSMPLKRDLHRQRQRINKIFIYFGRRKKRLTGLEKRKFEFLYTLVEEFVKKKLFYIEIFFHVVRVFIYFGGRISILSRMCQELSDL